MHELFADPVVMHGLNREPVSELDETAGSHAQPEPGWALIRAHWGFGYATEAAAAIRDWAYASRSIDLLVSLISPTNVRSQRVAKRLGATPTETVRPAHTQQKTVVWRHTPAA
jgi:RimJ/RimL family protein N-acetyltransferase